MQPTSTIPRKPLPTTFLGRPVFYGWWVVVSAFVLTAINGGLVFYGFSAFFLPLTEEFDVGRGTLSLVVGLGSVLSSGLLSPFTGVLVDRVGARRVTTFGLVLLGLGFVLLSRAPNIAAFFVIYLCLVTPGTALGTVQPVFAAVGKWFVKKRGMAFAIASSGTSVGAFVATASSLLIHWLGWRETALIIGIATWAIGLPIAALIRDRPEDHGLLPDGAAGRALNTPAGAVQVEETEFTAREALRTRAFWLMSIAFMLRTGVWVGVTAHFIPAMVDKNVSRETAATLLGVFGLISIPARLAVGALASRLDDRVLHGITAGVMALGLLVFVTTGGFAGVLVFLALYAIGGAGAAALMWSVAGQFFGRKSYATIMGMVSSVMVIGTATMPVLAGFSYDATKSYTLAFSIFAGVSLLSMLAMLVARKPVLERVMAESRRRVA